MQAIERRKSKISNQCKVGRTATSQDFSERSTHKRGVSNYSDEQPSRVLIASNYSTEKEYSPEHVARKLPRRNPCGNNESNRKSDFKVSPYKLQTPERHKTHIYASGRAVAKGPDYPKYKMTPSHDGGTSLKKGFVKLNRGRRDAYAQNIEGGTPKKVKTPKNKLVPKRKTPLGNPESEHINEMLNNMSFDTLKSQTSKGGGDKISRGGFRPGDAENFMMGSDSNSMVAHKFHFSTKSPTENSSDIGDNHQSNGPDFFEENTFINNSGVSNDNVFNSVSSMSAWSDFNPHRTGMNFPAKLPNVKPDKIKNIDKGEKPEQPRITGAFNKRASAIRSNRNLHMLTDDFLGNNNSVHNSVFVSNPAYKNTKKVTAKYLKDVEIMNNQIKKRWESVNLPKDLVL
jgi:hypothetical protein